MTYIRFIFFFYWFAQFLKFGALPSENPRCALNHENKTSEPGANQLLFKKTKFSLLKSIYFHLKRTTKTML